ncbi:MAG TPA: cysteine desulfurase family protein [Patescibacteria group bacterium]|nr:cysteine desulfurase family protein [Patescibacteria group bacterium]
MRRRVYLDNNATAPLRDVAREAIDLAMRRADAFGNPSSPHAFGHEARLALEDSRRQVAAAMGVEPGDVVFVSGGTESDNLAIQGVARAWTAAGRAPGHLVTSAVEHPAVLECCRHLESTGWKLSILPVDGQGLVDPDAVRAALRHDTALVSIMAANNETGVIQPTEEIAAVTRHAGVPLHVDAVQAIGRIPFEAARVGADYLSVSSHKLGGPAGIGALWIREAAPMKPLLLGGGQERRRRPGTESVMLAAGFAAAARAAGRELERAHPSGLRDRMERALLDRLAATRINGIEAPRLPNTSSLTFPAVASETIVIRMDLEGFALSTGSACSTGSARPSHVLAAMGLSQADAASTLRISLGPTNTLEEIDALVETLASVVRDLQASARLPHPAPAGGRG